MDSRILFILSNFIGDSVLASGVVEAWRKAYPKAEIVIAGPATVLELFQDLPKPVSFYLHEKRCCNYHWIKLFYKFFFKRIDHVIDFRRSAIGGLLGKKLHQGPAKNRDTHKIISYVKLLPSSYGGGGFLPHPFLRVSSKFKNDKSLPSNLIILAVGSSWVAKSWDAENFAKLGQMLAKKYKYKIGIAADNKAYWAKAVYDSIPDASKVNLIGNYSLPQISEIIRRAKVIVTNDSGLMHIAAAYNRPLVALFGPSSEKEYGPWGITAKDKKHNIVLRGKQSWQEIVNGRDFSRHGGSMVKGIKVEKVYDALLSLLESDKNRH